MNCILHENFSYSLAKWSDSSGEIIKGHKLWVGHQSDRLKRAHKENPDSDKAAQLMKVHMDGSPYSWPASNCNPDW